MSDPLLTREMGRLALAQTVNVASSGLATAMRSAVTSGDLEALAVIRRLASELNAVVSALENMQGDQ
jgi:hypothetical protein